MKIASDPIPLVDLTRQYASIKNEIDAAVQQILDRGTFAESQAVAAFENEFARYCGVRHCMCVNSGTSALHLAIIASGVQAGDEVITVPFTFIATAWAISYVGARPVFVDIETNTYYRPWENCSGDRTKNPRGPACSSLRPNGEP